MRPKEAVGNGAAAIEPAHPDWSQLLVDAVSKPGVISSAYSRFWNYSVGNQLLAMWQCMLRGLELGPIHTFPGWKELGRHVKKGEKALTLCMPVTVKRKRDANSSDSTSVRVGEGAEKQVARPDGDPVDTSASSSVTVFTYKPHWFVLSQTHGEAYQPVDLPAWSEATALATLKIESVPFRHPDGNCQGYAVGRSVSVSPIAVLPHKTLFHEVAHVVLGHTEEHASQFDDHEFTPRSLREVEAECVALICCESLNLPGVDCSRGYVQHWLAGQSIPERSAQKIFRAADQIIRAGRSTPILPTDSA